MEILITGGAGFIGSYLQKHYLELNHKITVVDDLSTGSIDNIDERSTFLQLDVRNLKKDYLEKFDIIFHLAAVVGVKRVMEEPLNCLNINLDGTKNILDNLVKMDKPPILFVASTSEIYGKNYKNKLSENDDCITGDNRKIRWVYAATKEMDEFLCNIYSSEYSNLKIIIGRLFSIVGHGQSSRYGMVMPRFINQAMNNNDITVYGDGTQIRSFMDVDNLVYCISKLIEKVGSFNKNCNVFNIGNPEPIMIKDLAWRIKYLSSSKSTIKYIPYEEIYGSKFEDMMRRVPDIGLLNSTIGDLNFYSLDQIINNMIINNKGI